MPRPVLTPFGAWKSVYGTSGEERLRLVDQVIEEVLAAGVHCDPEAIRAFCREHEKAGMLIDEDVFEARMDEHRRVSRPTAASS